MRRPGATTSGFGVEPVGVPCDEKVAAVSSVTCAVP